MRQHRARLTAGGLTADLRAPRNPGGNPQALRPFPTDPTDIRRKLDGDLRQLVKAMHEGRESTAWELVREARALAARLPRDTCRSATDKIRAAELLLRSPEWRRQAAAIRHRR
jgi:hypothetical protein